MWREIRKKGLFISDWIYIIVRMSIENGVSLKNEDVISVFIPPYGLQGQNFSCHLKWSLAYSVSQISIKIEEGLEFKNFYNVSVGNLSSSAKTEISINNVLENGYVGFVLGSKRLNDNSKTVRVEVICHLLKNDQEIEFCKTFEVNLFRPDLRIEETPEEISIRYSKDDLTPKVKGKVKVKNYGPGLALVFAYPDISSDIRTTNFFQDETSKFVSKLKTRFQEMKPDYPKQVKVLDLLIEVFTLLHEIEKGTEIDFDELKNKIGSLEIEHDRLEKNESDFLDEVSESIQDVFQTVFTASKEFQSMVKALESMNEQRVTLLNTLTSIEILKSESDIRLNLLYLDALGNSYPQLKTKKMKLILEAGSNVKIPMFQLIDMGGD